jgi:Tfp pilus assembly protein PilX
MGCPTVTRNSDERGMALVIALLVLLVLSLLATVLMVSVNVETKLAGHGVRETSALNVAEAGIGEAQARIADGSLIGVLAENPRHVAQIFNAPAGSVPVPGADTTGFATAQPTGSWLTYSRATQGPGVLTIEYKTNAARDSIYRYSPSTTPPVQTFSGFPIYRVTSTGTIGEDRRIIQTEVYATPVPALVQGAVMSNVPVDLGGSIMVDGHNHSSSMPTGTVNSNLNPTGTDPYHLDPATDVAGVWGTNSVTGGGNSVNQGNPPFAQNQVGPYPNPPTGFFRGPWDVFSMTQSQFFTWIGPPVATPPDPIIGPVYIDGDAAYHGGSGEGVLYVNGDLTINAGFTFRGLIYVEGDLKLNGHCWVLGAIIVKGATEVKIANGTADVYYSADMIAQAAGYAAGNFTRFSWRELPQ